MTTESIFSEPAPQIKALVRNLSAFTTLFAQGKSCDNVHSTAAPSRESRLTRSVANERIGFPVVEHQLLPGANKVVNALGLRTKVFICGAGSEKMDSVVKT